MSSEFDGASLATGAEVDGEVAKLYRGLAAIWARADAEFDAEFDATGAVEEDGSST